MLNSVAGLRRERHSNHSKTPMSINPELIYQLLVIQVAIRLTVKTSIFVESLSDGFCLKGVEERGFLSELTTMYF